MDSPVAASRSVVNKGPGQSLQKNPGVVSFPAGRGLARHNWWPGRGRWTATRIQNCSEQGGSAGKSHGYSGICEKQEAPLVEKSGGTGSSLTSERNLFG